MARKPKETPAEPEVVTEEPEATEQPPAEEAPEPETPAKPEPEVEVGDVLMVHPDGGDSDAFPHEDGALVVPADRVSEMLSHGFVPKD